MTLTAVSCGTEMSVVQEGIPDVIPAGMCCLGWQEPLVALAQLVEPNIAGWLLPAENGWYGPGSRRCQGRLGMSISAFAAVCGSLCRVWFSDFAM